MSSDWASELSSKAMQLASSVLAPLGAAASATGIGSVIADAERDVTAWFASTGLDYEPLTGVSKATGLGVDEVSVCMCICIYEGSVKVCLCVCRGFLLYVYVRETRSVHSGGCHQ